MASKWSRRFLVVALVAALLAPAALAVRTRRDDPPREEAGAAQQQQEVSAPAPQQESAAPAKGGSSAESSGPEGSSVDTDSNASEDSDEIEDDWVGKIIDDIKQGMKSGIIKAGGAKVTIVDNSNVAKHEEPDFEKLGEFKFKDAQEDAKKEHREGEAKRTGEEALKAEEQFSKKRVLKARVDVNKAVAEMEVEQDKKSLQEQQEKVRESRSKQAVEAGAKKAVQDTRNAIDKASRNAESEMTKKRVTEEASKRQAANKVTDAVNKELSEASKPVEVPKPEPKKEPEVRAEDYRVTWCDCETVGVNHNANSWTQCPGDRLITAMYRNTDQSLNGMIHFKCCGACNKAAKGRKNQKLGLENCYQADWVHSFDGAGWSRCRDGYYMRGLYRSSCNLIYCLEYAQCCAIKGSKGPRECGAQNAWGTSFDSQGWSQVDSNRFMNGLYRSGGTHWLYNIEHPMQCLA